MSNKTSHDSDVSFIKALAELLRANDLTELQVKRDYGENDSLNVRVSRQTQVVTQVSMPAAAPAAMAAPAAAAPAAVAAASDDPSSHPGAVNSPMVGTCYLSPEPGAAALLPIKSIDSPVGPIKVRPAFSTAVAKPAFSDKKP